MVAGAPVVLRSCQLATSVRFDTSWLSEPTATLAVAVRPPRVAVTVARPAPCAAAVNTPFPSTVPRSCGVTLQCAAAAGTVTGAWPAAVVPDRAKAWVAPLVRSGWFGDTAREASRSTTRSGWLVTTPPALATISPRPDRCTTSRPSDQSASPFGSTVTAGAVAAGLPSRSLAYTGTG